MNTALQLIERMIATASPKKTDDLFELRLQKARLREDRKAIQMAVFKKKPELRAA